MQTRNNRNQAKTKSSLKRIEGTEPGASRDIKFETVPISVLIPAPRNPRRHAKPQIKKLTASVEEFGFINPIIVDEANLILAGHARFQAAKEAGLLFVPIVRVSWFSEDQKRGYRIADNKIAEEATWDFEILAEDLKSLTTPEIAFNIQATGFETGELDVVIGKHAKPPATHDEADKQPAVEPDRPIITRPDDLWQVGRHRLLCGDAREVDHLAVLLDHEFADMVITDSPYNVKVDGFVCGLGNIKHDEFAMASGELTTEGFRKFLLETTNALVEVTRDGSMHFLFIDWRHIDDLLFAGRQVYSEVKAICVWNKANGGMGSLYRSKHEFIVVFKNGTAPHINNIELGKHGRNRTTVWDCPGVNSFGNERENLALHPTVKPVRLIEDAIMDCSDRNDRVLDVFCGSGTTLIAAERAGRVGFGLEIEPKFVDVALRRFRAITGEEPVRLGDSATLKSLE